jgi:hypothetical protein
MITREQLEERKAQIEQGIKRLELNIVANRGALQMVDELLAQMDAPEGDEG